VRFTGRAYVLPALASAAFRWSAVIRPRCRCSVRIGDRNLINTVIDSDFPKTLSSHQLTTSATNGGEKSGPANSHRDTLIRTHEFRSTSLRPDSPLYG